MNTAILQKVVNLYRKEGLAGMIKECISYLLSRSGIENQIQKFQYYRMGGSVSPQIDGVQPTFETESFPEYRRCTVMMNESNIIKDVLSEIRSGDVFYDVGANVGIYSAFVSEMRSNTTVVIFEPERKNADAIRRHVDCNGTNNILREVALGGKNGVTQLELKGDNVGEGRHQLVENNSKDSIEIKVRRGDDLIADGLPVPNVLKIDVEGAEVSVLKGLSTTLSKNTCRVIYIETHPEILEEHGQSHKDIIKMLNKFGFDIQYLSGKPGKRSHLKAVRN